ncbi:hypothetical protein, partial [Sphingobacterium sp. SGL-16]|uniref:hypothetical protein n=1 Tax=Sphingobacterium sp. SGL-16 TaxID=2710883 RepID=UPI0019D2DD23
SVTITKEAKIYSKTDTNSVETNYIQSGESLYMILDSSRKGFRKVKYNNRIGFIYRPSFKAYSPNLTAVNDSAKINRKKKSTSVFFVSAQWYCSC